MRALLHALGLLLLGGQALRAQGESVGGDSSPPYRNRIIGLPYVTYSPQTRLQFGVAGGYQFKWPGRGGDPETRPSYVAANGSYTQKGQWIAYLGASLYTPASRWWYSVDLSGGYFPVFYYGVGSRTEEADTNLMQSRFLTVNLRALRRISREWYVGPAFRLRSTFDLRWQFPTQIPGTLPGGRGGVSAGLGATALLEGRNSTTTPTRGRYLQLDYLLQAGTWGSDFHYAHLTGDGRVYLPVRHGRDVVALTLYGEYNGAAVPIQGMAMIGNVTSQTIMRGVYLGRFRDRHTLVTQAEYRGHLKGRLGYVVFGAGGNVFGSGANGLFDRFKVTYGAGLRFNVNPADPLNLRADFTLTNFGGGGLSLGATEVF